MDAVQNDLLCFHSEPYTFSEWWNLPHEDGCRFSLVDGSLLVSPAAGGPHQAATSRLANTLHDATSDHHASGLEVISRLTVHMGEHTALIPDIVLFTNPLPENYLDPSSVVCPSRSSTRRPGAWTRRSSPPSTPPPESRTSGSRTRHRLIRRSGTTASATAPTNCTPN